MFSFYKKVRSNFANMCGVVCDNEAFGGAEQHHGCKTVALHFYLSQSDGRTSGPDNFSNARNSLGAETESSDSRRTIDAKYVGDAKKSAHHQYSGVNRAVATRNRRNDKHDVLYPGNNSRDTKLACN